MRFVIAALVDRGVAADRVRVSLERNMHCGVGLCGHCQLRDVFVCVDGPGARRRPRVAAAARGPGGVSMARARKVHDRRPSLAVWKFASCDGCQLSLLDCEDELLAVAGARRIAYFPEATRGTVRRGPYDVSLVEGSITTPADAARIQEVRAAVAACWSPSAPAPRAAASRPCATPPTSTSTARSCTPTPTTSRRSRASTPIADHVTVDFELPGCPVDRASCSRCSPRLVQGRKPRLAGAQRLHRVQAARATCAWWWPTARRAWAR